MDKRTIVTGKCQIAEVIDFEAYKDKKREERNSSNNIYHLRWNTKTNRLLSVNNRVVNIMIPSIEYLCEFDCSFVIEINIFTIK